MRAESSEQEKFIYILYKTKGRKTFLKTKEHKNSCLRHAVCLLNAKKGTYISAGKSCGIYKFVFM